MTVVLTEIDLNLNMVPFFSKLANIVQELIENEKTYIDKLTAGIKVYVEPLRGNNLPRSLRGHMYNIFANIVQIRDFHEQTFYPSLMACNGDVIAISDTFSHYIQVSVPYMNRILHAFNSQISEWTFIQLRSVCHE